MSCLLNGGPEVRILSSPQASPGKDFLAGAFALAWGARCPGAGHGLQGCKVAGVAMLAAWSMLSA